MPIYEYRCRSCGETFEAFRAISDEDAEVKCPKCGGTNPQRVISSFFGKGGCGGASGSLRFPT